MRNTKNGKTHTPNSNVKIPPKEAPIILDRSESGESQEQIAADYGVTQQRVQQIIKRETKNDEKRAKLKKAHKNAPTQPGRRSQGD